MKNTIKFAAFSAMALAASSTAALAGSETAPGVSTGFNLASPLPEGVYFITNEWTQQAAGPNAVTLLSGQEVAVQQLIWSTPWQIAGGRIQLDGFGIWANIDSNNNAGYGPDGWVAGQTDISIHWNFGNGFSFGQAIGAYWGLDSSIIGITNDRWDGYSAFAYKTAGYEVLANFIYGGGGDRGGAFTGAYDPAYFNYDLTVERNFGKFRIGAIVYGATDLENGVLTNACTTGISCKSSMLAVGGLIAYDFGSFDAVFKLATDVEAANGGGTGVFDKTTTGWLQIVKPLWTPEEGPLK